MPTRNRFRLRGSSGETLGDISPPPSKLSEFEQQWIRWIYNLYDYVGIINENFLTVEDWHEIGATGEPAFQNSWADAGANPAFYKDPFGIVRIKGDLDTGVSGTVAFTLPVDYRPDEALFFVILQSGAAAGTFARIATNGEVTITRTGATVHLNNISFRV